MGFVRVKAKISHIQRKARSTEVDFMVDTGGHFIRSRRFRLSPPERYRQVLSEKFNISTDKIDELKKQKVFGFELL